MRASQALTRCRTLVAALAVAGVVAAPVPGCGQEGAAAAAARESAYSEEEVKAAFLYNFGSYVQWPVADRPNDTISIAVLAAPEVAAELERFVRGRTIAGRPVRVHRLREISDLEGDEVLFIGAAENGRLSQLIDALDGSPTLVVSDAPDGLSEGAMINFRLVERRVRFEVSVPRAQEAGLMLSSRLLSAALRVETTRRDLEQRASPALAGALRHAAFGVPAAVSACGAAPDRCPSRI
ncbi:MAG: YfiR family protein [Gammaproteobacteria bacterium]|nr:YfiR family protein [Gammaproteobacteria bacterium]